MALSESQVNTLHSLCKGWLSVYKDAENAQKNIAHLTIELEKQNEAYNKAIDEEQTYTSKVDELINRLDDDNERVEAHEILSFYQKEASYHQVVS